MPGLRNLVPPIFSCILLLSSSCAPTEDEVITADNVKREGSPGVFLDSAVGGVDYYTSSRLGGVTDSSGTFYYNPGDQVSFTIGGISLGSVTGATKLTPVEVMGASGTADQKVINLSRLLQTLDADGDPSNGINITTATKTTLQSKSVDFDVSVDSFDNATKSVTAAVGKTMVSATKAIKHLHSTLNDQGLSSKVASDLDLQRVSSELDNFTTVPAGFTVSENATALSEASGNSNSDKFTVVLGSEPIDNVVFSVVPSDASEVATTPSSLIFSSDNWSTAQTVTLKGVDDEISDGTIASSVAVGINREQTKDSDYDKLSSHTLTATTSDDEGTPSITMTAEATSLAEGAGSITLTLTMSLAAGKDTTINLSNSGTATINTDYSISSGTITIPAGSKTSTFTVKSIDDQIDDDNEEIVVGVGSVSGGNGASNNVQSVTLTISDDDTAGFALSKTTAAVTESGNDDTFTVVLNSEPTHDVVFTLISDDTGEATVFADNLTFTSKDWSTAQTVTVKGVVDNQDDGNAPSKVTIVVGSSNDANYGNNSLSSQTVTVTTSDGDTAGFALSKTTVSATEGGTTDNFTVVLNSKPTHTVTITITGTSEVTVAPTSLSFDSSNWNTAQNVAVTAVNDSVDDDQQTSTITVSVSNSNDSKYGSGISNQSVTATTTDDDTAAFTVTESGGSTIVDESGGNDSIVIVLGSEPTGDVVFSLTANDSTEATIAPSTLTFTTSNWNSAQIATVTGVDDNLDDDNVSNTVIVAVNQNNTADTKYDALDNQSVTVTTTDNDSAPKVTLLSSSSSFAENNGTTVLTATLDTAATSDITVALFLSGGGTLDTDYSISSTTLNIPADNMTATATLTGISDQFVEGSESIVIDISGVSGGNASESGTQQQVITITDDDNATVMIADVSALESAGTVTVALRLNNAVAGGFTVGVATTDGTATAGSDYTALSSTVTFAGNAGETQQVSITLDNDSIVEDNETITIGMSNASNSGVIVTDTATVNITNDDTVGFDLSGTTASVSENGTSSSISVVLMSEPTANVTLALSDNDTSEVVYPTSVIFGSGNWSTSQTITLTGKDDSVDDGNQTTLLTLTPSGGGYGGLSAQTLTVTTTDNDTVGFSLSGTTASVSENGTSSSISVVLMSEPTANVTLALSDNDTSEVVYPTSVIFGSGNWSTSQTITLTGKDDSVDDGNQTTLLTLTPSGGGYSGLSAQTLTVTTTDDDAPYVAITSGHCESNNYDKVTNASTCQTAATSLDYNYSGTTNWSDQPQRCFVNSSNNNVYYNQYNTGNVNVEDNSQSSAYLCAR